MKTPVIVSALSAFLAILAPTANAQGPVTTANNDTVITALARGPIPITNLLANDTDPQNDPLTIVSVGTPQFGKVEIRRVPSFSIIYTPSSAFLGTDSFTYQINDRPNGTGNSSTATVTIRNPFLIGKGIYAAPISGAGGSHDVSGYLSMTVASTGDFSCFFRFAGAAYRFRGQFDLNGNFSGEISRPGLPSLQLALLFPPDGKSRQLTGTLSFGAESVQFVAPLIAWSDSRPSLNFGRYTMVIPAPNTATTTPQGHGFATISISRKGAVTIQGRAGDNRPFSSATYVQPDGYTTSLYGILRNTGSIFGNINTGNSRARVIASGFTASLRWFAVRDLKRRDFPRGFDLTVTPRGSLYSEPRPGDSIVRLPKVIGYNGDFTALSGGLPAPRTERVVIGNRPIAGPYLVEFDNSKRLAAKLVATAKSGLFTGTFYDATSRLTRRMTGVFIQGENKAFGIFKTPSRTGRVELQSNVVSIQDN